MSNPPDIDNEESLVSRWSRRKQDARETVDHPLDPLTPPAQDESSEMPRALTDADMPDLDSMDESSDYSGFLSPQVSDQLRTRALRQLFRLPGLGVRDGLDDYDDDFTQMPTLGNVVTHEMRRMLARELSREDNESAPVETAGRETDDVVESPDAGEVSENNEKPQGAV